ncbi:MAG: ABC transporter permease, partial [Acidobacteria bacterium]|nr:ABC transporter permease [Acidobacteriota bacterium]
MRRDRLTFGMMIGIPIVQLILFGYAINMDPKHLPTAILINDEGPYGRTILYSVKNSGYFDIIKEVNSEEEAKKILQNGQVQFVINIPSNFFSKHRFAYFMEFFIFSTTKFSSLN